LAHSLERSAELRTRTVAGACARWIGCVGRAFLHRGAFVLLFDLIIIPMVVVLIAVVVVGSGGGRGGCRSDHRSGYGSEEQGLMGEK